MSPTPEEQQFLLQLRFLTPLQRAAIAMTVARMADKRLKDMQENAENVIPFRQIAEAV